MYSTYLNRAKYKMLNIHYSYCTPLYYIFLASIKQIFLQLCSTEPNTGDRGQNLLKLYSSFMPLSVNNETELKKIERFSNISKVYKRY